MRPPSLVTGPLQAPSPCSPSPPSTVAWTAESRRLMRTIQEERAARGDGRTVARTVSHALAAWEADSGPTHITRITRLALIWPYAGVIAGIAPLESSAIEGIVAAGVHVLATVRDQP